MIIFSTRPSLELSAGVTDAPTLIQQQSRALRQYCLEKSLQFALCSCPTIVPRPAPITRPLSIRPERCPLIPIPFFGILVTAFLATSVRSHTLQLLDAANQRGVLSMLPVPWEICGSGIDQRSCSALAVPKLRVSPTRVPTSVEVLFYRTTANTVNITPGDTCRPETRTTGFSQPHNIEFSRERCAPLHSYTPRPRVSNHTVPVLFGCGNTGAGAPSPVLRCTQHFLTWVACALLCFNRIQMARLAIPSNIITHVPSVGTNLGRYLLASRPRPVFKSSGVQ